MSCRKNRKMNGFVLHSSLGPTSMSIISGHHCSGNQYLSPKYRFNQRSLSNLSYIRRCNSMASDLNSSGGHFLKNRQSFGDLLTTKSRINILNVDNDEYKRKTLEKKMWDDENCEEKQNVQSKKYVSQIDKYGYMTQSVLDRGNKSVT